MFVPFPCSGHNWKLGKNSKSQQRTKHAENLHKHAHAAILPNNALLAPMQISAQKRSVALHCAGKHSWTILLAAQIKEERFKSFFWYHIVLKTSLY